MQFNIVLGVEQLTEVEQAKINVSTTNKVVSVMTMSEKRREGYFLTSFSMSFGDIGFLVS